MSLTYMKMMGKNEVRMCIERNPDKSLAEVHRMLSLNGGSYWRVGDIVIGSGISMRVLARERRKKVVETLKRSPQVPHWAIAQEIGGSRPMVSNIAQQEGLRRHTYPIPKFSRNPKIYCEWRRLWQSTL